ncbi:MAG: hypothetical protein QNJ75_01450 [Acidimicrobiia bacterium]|nr:hypothetical protein [Acidimicrobiia bacterium]
MNTKTLRTTVAAAMGGAVLMAGLLVGASFAFAEEANEPEVTVDDKSADRCRGHFHGLFGDIADELDIDLDEIKTQLREGATLQELVEDLDLDLDAALDAVKDRILSELDERVAEGDLSEERADDIRERIESFDLDELPPLPRAFERFGRDFGDMRGFGGFDFDFDLGELREKLESGLSLDEALSELGVDVEGMLEDARSAALERIDDLVADGVISQERADALKERLESFDPGEGFPFGLRGFDLEFDFDDFDFERFWGPHGHERGFGFFGDRGDDRPDDVNAEDASLSA